MARGKYNRILLKLNGEALAGEAGWGIEAGEGLVQRGDMAPEDDIEPVRAEIEQGEEDLMLVGHLPFLAKLAAKLLVGDDAADPVAFQKGGVACLERGEGGRWRIAWMLTPKVV